MGIASTATATIAAKIIPNERRGEGTGYYALSVVLAAAVRPFLGMFLSQYMGVSINFGLCILLIAFSLITIFFLKVPKIQFTKTIGVKNNHKTYISTFHENKNGTTVLWLL